MDGFDDLLSSSSLEHNPFASPFDKPRSSSPDPWSSFGQQQTHETYNAGFEERFSEGKEPTDEIAAHKHQEVERSRGNEERPDTHSAYEAVSTTVEDSEDRESSLQSPGFRESSSGDDVAEQSPVESPSRDKQHSADDAPQPTPDVPARPDTPKLPSWTNPIANQTRIPCASSPSIASSSKRFVSPLESPTPGVTQAFASLALGGESIGGWQDFRTEHTSSVSRTTETEQREAETEPSTVSAAEDKENQSDIKKDSGPRPLFFISVEDPQKVGDPIRPYILYTVHTKTTSLLFSKPSFSVLRRYSDFLWLYDTLCLSNPGVIVPPVPEKNPFGRFDNLFVQQRRLALEICIQKIANHPVLAKDPDLKLFLESDNFALDIKHRKTESVLDRGGILSTISQTLTGSKFFEVDDWFDRKKAYLDGLESQLKGLVKSIDIVSKQREESAIATGEFALSVGELSESDLNTQLCRTLTTLSDVEKKAQDLQHMQAQEDTITLMATVEEYSRVINSVRVAFATRVRCHSQWQNAESELRRVKQAYERARSQGRIPPERTGHSLAQIAEAERRAVDAKYEFERCSRLVKTELTHFEEERIGDFKRALETFLEGMIQQQKELIKAWEGYQELLLKRVNPQPVIANSQEQTSAAQHIETYST